MKLYSLVIYVMLISLNINAQILNPEIVIPISISGFGMAVQENFNSLANADSSNVIMQGWQLREAGSTMSSYYTAGNGSSNRGDIYSFGSTNSTDRALGTLLTSQIIPSFGIIFINNTGDTIKGITISFTGEQWRIGSLNRTDRLDFQYHLNTTNINNSTGWIDVNELDFNSPVTTGSTGAKDGNSSAFQTKIIHTINGLSILPGKSIAVRFLDIDASNVDDGLAIDDFVLVAHKDEQLPVVATIDLQNQLSNYVAVNGEVLSAGNNSVTARGVVIGNAANPTLSSYTFITNNGSGAGHFLSEINTLLPNTTYYLRTYAVSNSGTSYGQELSFTTPALAKYYRSRASGDWSVPNNWETTFDPSLNDWSIATLPPSYTDNTIRIRNGHTINFSSAIMIDQMIIEVGGILERTGGDLHIHDGVGNDMIVLGKFIHKSGTSTPVFEGTMQIRSGATLEVQLNSASSYYGLSNKIFYENGATYYWNVASSATILNGTYFPNATEDEVPVFKLKTGGFSFGGNISNPTIINGIFEIESGTITVQHNGPKIFRNGIRGNGNLVQKVGTNECGPIIINGKYAELGGAGTISLNSAGLLLDTQCRLKLISGKAFNGGIFTVSGYIDFQSFQITGSTSISFNSLSTVTTAHSNGLNGSLANSGQVAFSDSVSFVYNGIIPQETGSFLPTRILSLEINNKGTGVSLTTTTTIIGDLRLFNGKLLTTSSAVIDISSSASITGGSVNSYINGPVSINLLSTTETRLPLGKGMAYKPLAIIPSIATPSSFHVEYFDHPHSTLNTGNNLSAISHSEYWNIIQLSGSDPAKVKLFWNDDQQFSRTDNIVVSSLIGNVWENKGNGTTIEGNNIHGNITSFALDQMGPVTFGFTTMGGALPVTLRNFDGKRINNNNVQLNWTTMNEVNNSHFEIERSLDGNIFVAIGTVAGNGTTSSAIDYRFTDKEALYQKSYYRLKQIDLNGIYEYHKAIAIKHIEKNIEISVYPNPASTVLNIALSNTEATFYDIIILDVSGKILLQKKLNAESPYNSIDVSGLLKGNYIVIIDDNMNRHYKKFVKQ